MKRNLFHNFRVIPVEKKTHKPPPPPILAPTEEVFEKIIKDTEPTVEELLAEAVAGQTPEDEIFEQKCQKNFNRVFRTEAHRVTTLIQGECSFYFSNNSGRNLKHYCPLRETEAGSISMQCIYFEDFDIDKLYRSSSFDNMGTHPRCEHFEKNVLPVRNELTVAYRAKRNMRMITYFRRCNRCESHFVSGTKKRTDFPHDKLCDKCTSL